MSWKRTIVVMCLGCCVSSAAGGEGDALDEALAEVGMRRADLGWRPKGWWPQYPANIPYKLRCFDALLSAPLDAVTFARSLARSAKDHLDPAVLDTKPERFGGHLYKAVHALAVNPKFGGLRGYTANLTAEDTPLDEAILALHRAAGRPTKFVTFDTVSPYPDPAGDLNRGVAVIPESIRPVLGRLVMNIVDAHRWVELAFRNVEMDKRMVVAGRMNLGEEQTDALDYCSEMDDIAGAWDQASLWYAGGKCVQAIDDARMALADAGDVPPFAFDWETPWGWIRIRGGGPDVVDGTNALLIVDLGGDDRYTGSVGASAAGRPIGVLLDCGGDDAYDSIGPAQGAGVCGVGVLMDARGDDTYRADRMAQGLGQFGLGVCADLNGDDTYFVKYSGQGCGYFGSGLLIDAAGKDSYRIWADGQGLGGVAGVGVLADRSGDDRYEAVRDAKITGRGSYHSEGDDISVSNAQGCAMGRRGDGADGHSWAGGLGALLDSQGSDRYVSGNWSQGTGYWFGTGLLHDGSGDDEYHGVVWSQGSGAHFCVGALIDEAGDDLHIAEVTSNNSLAFGHDFAVALLVNLGGNDTYEVKQSGIGYSINRSVAALIDVGGDDTYRGRAGDRPGMAIFDERFRARDGVSGYFSDTSSVGLFVDVGGTDTYWSGHADNGVWTDEASSPNPLERNFSVGVDRENGAVSFRPIPERTPSRSTAR